MLVCPGGGGSPGVRAVHCAVSVIGVEEMEEEEGGGGRVTDDGALLYPHSCHIYQVHSIIRTTD